MQPEAGQVHVFRPAGSIEDGEDIFHFFSLIRTDPLGFSLFKQPSQSPMPEASNHDLPIYTNIKCDKRQLSHRRGLIASGLWGKNKLRNNDGLDLGHAIREAAARVRVETEGKLQPLLNAHRIVGDLLL